MANGRTCCARFRVFFRWPLDVRRIMAERRVLLVLSAVFGLLSMLSKEMGLAVLPAIPALDLFWTGTRALTIFPSGNAGSPLTGPRWSISACGPWPSGISDAWPVATNFVSRTSRGFGVYSRKVIWPPPQSAFVTEVPHGLYVVLVWRYRACVAW